MGRTNIKTQFQKHIEDQRNVIVKCSTSAGFVVYFPAFFEQVRSFPQANQILGRWELELRTVDQIAHENSRLVYTWFRERFLQLLGMHDVWEDQKELKQWVEGIVGYNFLGGNGGYFQKIKQVFHEASFYAILRRKDHHGNTLEWAKAHRHPVEQVSDIELIFPAYVAAVVNKKSFEEELYSWNIDLDLSYLDLLRLFNVLSKYNSFPYLETDPEKWKSPQNFDEFEEVQYRYYVGTFLNTFKIYNPPIRCLSVEELIKRLDLFLGILEKEIARPALKGPALQKEMSAHAEKYCVDILVNHIKGLSSEELKNFRKKRNGLEITQFLQKKANETQEPFVEVITKTMVEERAGPKANRILREKFRIIWRPQRN